MSSKLTRHQTIVKHIQEILEELKLITFVKQKWIFREFIPDIATTVGCKQDDRLAIDALGSYRSFNRDLGGLTRIRDKVKRCYMVVDNYELLERLTNENLPEKIRVVHIDHLRSALIEEIVDCCYKNIAYYERIRKSA